jgi:hypothetical protein
MVRSTFILICAAVCLGQTPKEPAKPPADVDQALRARVQEFFQYHVTGEFRKAEPLVAEDTKDLFYNRNKPRYLKFVEIARIDYSENFTKATATVMVVSPQMIAGWGGGPPTIPIPSTWKIENGKWCWYLEPEAFLRTPFGSFPISTVNGGAQITPGQLPASMNPMGLPPAGPLPAPMAPPAAPPTAAAPVPAPAVASPTPDPAALAAIAGASQLGMSPGAMPGAVPAQALGLFKPDKSAVSLSAGTPAKITFSNTAADARSIILLGGLAGVEAKFDRTEVRPGQSAVLTLQAGKDAKGGTLNLVIPQTAEMLTIQVTVK